LSPSDSWDGTNQSILRAVAVLRAVADAPGGLRVSDLARVVSLAYPTTSRVVQTLERERFLARASGTRKVVLGPGLLRLTDRAGHYGALLTMGRPHVEGLAQRLGEAVEFSAVVDAKAPDLAQAIHILVRVETEYLLRASPTKGRIPLHATSIGKILLANRSDAGVEQLLGGPLEPMAKGTITDPLVLRRQLTEAKDRGFAEAVDELEEGVSALSTGIHDGSGLLVGILNVDGPTRRLESERRAEIAAMMLRTTAAIEADLLADVETG